MMYNIEADHFTLGMSMKRLKGKFRLSSTTSLPATITSDEWTKYDDRLIDAAYRSDTDKIKETIRKKGACPVKVSRDGQTALHISVKKNLVECVEFMLAESPDLSTTDIQGRTVYHVAAANGNTVLLKKFLDYSRWNLDIKDVKEMTALHHAVISAENACVKMLLDCKAPVDSRDGEGRTPLLIAIINGLETIALTLIIHGADVNAQDYRERTPIIMSCIQGMSQVVESLISKGADSKIADAEGKTLEEIAAEAGHVEIVEILKSGIDTTIVDTTLVDTDHEDITLNSDSDQIAESSLDESIEDPKPEVLQSTQSKRRSILKSEDSSFTTSIIESLMGYDVSSDTISEMSATEDQLHMKEKVELEKKEMENDIAVRDKKIEELQNEISQLKSKLRRETDIRFAAEKEVLDLKLQLENTSEKKISVSFMDQEDSKAEDSNDQPEDEQSVQQESNEDSTTKTTTTTTTTTTTDGQVVDDEKKRREHKQKAKGYESDESINLESGYRKKSLGTAKQHIDMLEEHILSLEEDLVTKDGEIHELEKQLQTTRKLVDLNNNTTVSLEVFNQYKAEKKTERNKFKEEIRGFETQINILENKVQDMEQENKSLTEKSESKDTELSQQMDKVSELRQENEDSQKQFQAEEKTERNKFKEEIRGFETQINILENKVQDMEQENKSLTEKSELKDTELSRQMDKVSELRQENEDSQKQFQENEEQHTKDIYLYREQLLSVFQNTMDGELREILTRIVKLRTTQVY